MGRGAADQRLNDDRAMFQEKFVPPQTSIANYFMTKVILFGLLCVVYLVDSANSEQLR
jgi:hypothetical protein